MKTQKRKKPVDKIVRVEKKIDQLGDKTSRLEKRLEKEVKRLETTIQVENAKTYGLLKVQIDEVKEKIKLLPTKDEHFVHEDRIVTELQKIRENMEVMTGWKDQMEDLEVRVETVETQLKVSPKN